MAERRKRTNEFIPDEKSRLACFKRRSKTLIKNASELSILCVVDVAAIIFADNLPHQPLLFPPDPSERERIIRRFQQSRRRGPNHENQRSNSNDKERAYISCLSSAELKSLCRSLDAKIDEFDKRINALRQRDALSVICPAIQPQWQRRVFNLAALLENVLQKAQSELFNWRGSGFSVMEMSDRVKAFLSVMQKAESDLRLLLGISNEYAVLFLKGGAATQFSALPLNLDKPEGLVHCLVTGYWGDQASKEALEYNVNYFHLCANETSRAVELPGLVIGDLSLLDVSKLGPIYARARNNFGPSGVTLAVIKQSRR